MKETSVYLSKQKVNGQYKAFRKKIQLLSCHHRIPALKRCGAGLKVGTQKTLPSARLER
jgi:hypothetical protein